MRKILTYCSFAVASVVVVGAFVTSSTYTQLIVAILLYPLLITFAFKTFPRKTKSQLLKEVVPTVIASPVKPSEKTETTKTENMMGIADIDKRVFLKLIGGVGLSLFIFSILNKKAEGMFFKNIPGSVSGSVSLEDGAGKKIDPAQNQPTDGFSIAEIDDNIITFYGFTNKDGGWFVMKEDTETGSFRYAKGDSNFPGNWTNREKLKYDYFNNAFRPSQS